MPAIPKATAGAGLAAALATTLTLAVPFVTGWEGERLDPYFDSVGVRTVCIGETNVPMRRYSQVECRAMFRERFAEFALKVQKLSPGIEKSPYEWLAHTSLAYNVGVGAYQKSSVRSLFVQGRPVQACRAIRQYKFAGGQVLAGLVARREGKNERLGEYEVCLVGAVPKELG